jgi:hypothetical protein
MRASLEQLVAKGLLERIPARLPNGTLGARYGLTEAADWRTHCGPLHIGASREPLRNVRINPALRWTS